jgi:hypothetical protein
MNKLSPEKESAIALLDEGEEYVALFFRKAKGLDIFSRLKEKGWFSPDKNPAPVEAREEGYNSIPYWPVLEYLEKISSDCALPENREYAEELMEIIRSVTRPPDTNKVDNYRTWHSFTKILAKLPTDVIRVEDIELVADWLDSRFSTSLVSGEIGRSLLPKLLKEESGHDLMLAEKIVEVVTRVRLVEKKMPIVRDRREAVPVLDPYWLNRLFEQNGKKLGEKCGRSVIDLLQKRLFEVMRYGDQDRFSYLWRPVIEDDERNLAHMREAENILVSALRDTLFGYSNRDPNSAKNYVKEFYSKGSQVLTRLALHITNERYDLFREVFWDVLSPDLFNRNLQHELYLLLDNRFREFAHEQQSRVVEIIDDLVADWVEGEKRETANAYIRLEWLCALKEKGNRRVDQLYEKYLKITGREPENPDLPYPTGAVWGKDKSPYSVHEIAGKKINEIVELLNDFKESGEWESPNEKGLGDTLREAVKQNPSYFWNDLSPFLETKTIYQYSLLKAFEDLWNANTNIDWNRILDFCWKIVESDSFWEKNGDKESASLKPTRGWMTSCISDLIRAGVQKDEWAFEPVYLPIAERIILRILEKEPSTAKGDERDALTEAINTPKGCCVEALFSYSLRRARLEDKKIGHHEKFWESIRKTYDRELGLCDRGNFEFSTLCGTYLPNLLYLNKEWLTENVDNIFSKKSEKNWLCAVQGYAHINRIYQDIYALLRQHGHLSKVLNTVFDNERVRERIIDHISVAYLHGEEGLDENESLFTHILRQWREKDISHIIWFFWTLREERDEKMQNRVLEFWKWCSNRIGENKENNANVLSDLNQLAVFLEKIDEEKKSWLMQSAPYVEEKYHATFFLEYLDRLASNHPREVGEIYEQMLSRCVPEYPLENVRSIVTKLYEAGVAEAANRICDTYYGKGLEFLRDLYDKYNTTQT